MLIADWHLFAAFAAASFILIIVPGPVVTFLIATGIRHGRAPALAALAGATLANATHALLVWAGLAAVIALLGHWFEVIRWIGVAYLVWLGIAAWRAPADTPAPDEATPARGTAAKFFRRGLLVGLTNPKTLIFYAAFFPQFVAAGEPVAPQLAALGATFVTIGLVCDGAYALLASGARHLLASPALARWRNRVSGTLLAGAGAALAFNRN